MLINAALKGVLLKAAQEAGVEVVRIGLARMQAVHAGLGSRRSRQV